MNFPIFRYMAVWPSRRVVRVKIDRVRDGTKRIQYPLKVTSTEPNVSIANGITLYMNAFCEDGFYIADLDTVTFYKSRKQGEKTEMENVHKQYAQLRRDLRTAQKKYKWGLKVVAEYKKFKQIQTPFFVK